MNLDCKKKYFQTIIIKFVRLSRLQLRAACKIYLIEKIMKSSFKFKVCFLIHFIHIY
jgi:hypothetical protein